MTIALEKLVENEPNRYRLVLMAARRANDLVLNSASQETPGKKKMTSLVLEEIASGKVRMQYENEKKKAKK